MRKTVFLLASLFVMVLATQRVNAQDPSTATATDVNVTATIITPITIEKVADLSFGNIAAGTTTGSVTINPATGERTGLNVMLATNPSATATGNAAKFTVSGDAGAGYTIVLPSDGDVTISGPTEADPMTVTSFTSSPSGENLVLTNGTQDLFVGATLNVAAGQASGTYTGTFDVTVAYN